MSRVVVVALTLLAAAAAQAEPRTLRFATVAPDGTVWARQSRAFAREVEDATHGELRIKWYFGAITGNDRDTLQHIRAHTLDGTAGSACGLLSTSLHVTNVVGLFRNRDEATFILRKIRSTTDEEMRANGFTDLGLAGFGLELIFSRRPVRSFADLRRGNFWMWDMEYVGAEHLRAMGVHLKTGAAADAAHDYDSGRVDGFVSAPTPALGLQWTAQAHYFSELPTGFAPICLVIANATMDALPLEQQRVLRAAGERLAKIFDQTGSVQDQELLHGLFEKQGLERVPVDVAFRDEFFEAARAARPILDAKLVPPAMFRHVLDLLADYRAERAQGAAR